MTDSSTTTLYRAGRAPRRRGSLLRRALVLLVVLVVLFVAYAGGVYLWAGTQLRTTDAFTDYPGRPAESAGTDWLLIGSDSRERLTPRQREELHVGNDAGLNTDTIMLLHHGDSGPYLVSIPRDSYVEIPGHGRNKINSAYSTGGAELLTRTVETATGIRLDHYGEVDFLGFTDIVDSLGGVTVCVPGGGLRDGRSGADFDAGCQEMDGTQALSYVRARYADPRGDLGRTERQQQVVSAIAHEASSARVLLEPWRLVPFVDASLAALTVDGSVDIAALVRTGWRVKGLPGGEGASLTVPVAAEPTLPGVGSVVEWDEAEAARLFAALREDAPVPASVTD